MWWKTLSLIQNIEKRKLKYHGVANVKKKTDLGLKISTDLVTKPERTILIVYSIQINKK